jgi:hypothetical protein
LIDPIPYPAPEGKGEGSMQFAEIIRYAIDTFGFAIIPIEWPDYDVPIEELRATEFQYDYGYYWTGSDGILKWIQWPYGDCAIVYRANEKPNPAYVTSDGLQWYETRGYINWYPLEDSEAVTIFLGHDKSKFFPISMIEQ